METIDFVLPWVDNNSPSWIAERERVWNLTHPQERKESGDDNGASRYREMGMLEYWFRSVEKFAPWVNKVFFVTCGQKPDWLNVDNPKLVLVDHKDYIPAKYLPTFNSNVIELNLFRIAELSEHFVLFNDDVFLTRPVSPEFFFVNGQPSLSADLTICDYYGVNYWSYACFNDSCVLNDHFNMYESIAKNRDKWFSVKKLGWRSALKNRICHTINRTMFNRGYEHLSNAHLKSTFRTVWETERMSRESIFFWLMGLSSMRSIPSLSRSRQSSMVSRKLSCGLFSPWRRVQSQIRIVSVFPMVE